MDSAALKNIFSSSILEFADITGYRIYRLHDLQPVILEINWTSRSK